jgi:hypothetical protein
MPSRSRTPFTLPLALVAASLGWFLLGSIAQAGTCAGQCVQAPACPSGLEWSGGLLDCNGAGRCCVPVVGDTMTEDVCNARLGICNSISTSCEDGETRIGTCKGTVKDSACCKPTAKSVDAPTGPLDAGQCTGLSGVCNGTDAFHCPEGFDKVGVCASTFDAKACCKPTAAKLQSVSNTPTTTKRIPLPVAAPKLNVPIPGLEFANNIPIENDTVTIPFIGQYVSAFYKYLVGISVIAAAVMIVYGGFLYVLGASIGEISSAKEIIADAIIGLVLVLGTYSILKLINPATVGMNAVKIKIVSQSPFDLGSFNPAKPLGNAPLSPELIKEALNAPEDPKNTDANSTDANAAANAALATSIPGDIKENASAIVSAAKRAGVDPCTLLAVCEHLTGIRNIWSGIQNKTSRYVTESVGPCLVSVSNLKSECSGGSACTLLSYRLRNSYPDFPRAPNGASEEDEKKARKDKIDWLLKNPEASAYAAALVWAANVDSTNNELMAIAGYGAGLASIKGWVLAHECTPKAGLRVKDAKSLNLNDMLEQSCIPHSVAIASTFPGYSTCPQDKLDCVNVKLNGKNEYEGNCATHPSEKCYAVVTDDLVRNIVQSYDRMATQYQCNN